MKQGEAFWRIYSLHDADTKLLGADFSGADATLKSKVRPKAECEDLRLLWL